MNLHGLSNVLVLIVAALLLLGVLVILLLGGTSLLGFLRVTLLQAFGFVIAATASLFFFLRLVHNIDSGPMRASIVVFIVGVAIFLSVSVGKAYLFQYPMYVQSFGPGKGPGLPLQNVLTFFRRMGGATIVEFTLDYPGSYVLVDHALMRTDKGAWGVLQVSGVAKPAIFHHD